MQEEHKGGVCKASLGHKSRNGEMMNLPVLYLPDESEHLTFKTVYAKLFIQGASGRLCPLDLTGICTADFV